MINRSLIRIKTVQILYSYLLTRSDFVLPSAPDATSASRDKLFAYSVYLDLLGLLLKLSGKKIAPNAGLVAPEDPVLKKNPIAAAIAADSAVHAVLFPRGADLRKFDSILNELSEAISSSAIYSDFRRKRKLTGADYSKFWTTLFATTVRKNKNFERILRNDEYFSLKGLEMGLSMFEQTLNSYDDSRATYLKARADLDTSMRQAYNLYIALLMLPVRLTRLQDLRLDNAKNKYLPTPEELNPNLRFVNNLLVEKLRNSKELESYISEFPVADPANWRDFDICASKLLDAITSTELYAKYMETEAGDFVTDASFWREVMKTIIIPSDELAEILETGSVYWNDDLEIMSTFVLKTLRRSYARNGKDDDEADEQSATDNFTLLPMFMNREDERFGAELFEKTVSHRDELREFIDSFIDAKTWDTERIAFMDVVILMVALTEIMDYPKIPAQVSMNEYIDIANHYCAPRSGSFINGVLRAAIAKLNESGKIHKPLESSQN